LAENYFIIRDIAFQWMAVCENNEIKANSARAEKDGKRIITRG
jgi:hypothetical protein